MRFNYKHTLYACYFGYITQAIVNNLMPLLFATFNKAYGISLDKIGFLITLNFAIQMTVDFLSARYAHKFGYRMLIVFAHFAATAGLLLMGIAPLFGAENVYLCLITSVVVYAIGGGIIEVLVSPMVEAMPLDNKAGTMSFLHSFYCWGQVGVTLISTLYFVLIGLDNWYFLPVMWAIVPLANGIAFLLVPIYVFGDGENRESLKDLFSTKIFWMFALLMLGAGASELAMSQWSSYFAEIGLLVSKTVGDLLGPCMFAILMGISRVMYSKVSMRINLVSSLTISSMMCVLCYLIAALSPYPMLSIIGCALCGFSVGIMWPGVYSLAAAKHPSGGTAMFALLALAGDVGCMSGPSMVGYVSNFLGGTTFALKFALSCMVVFPILMIIVIKLLQTKK